MTNSLETAAIPHPDKETQNIFDLLLVQATSRPQKQAVVMPQSNSLTYAELMARCKAVAKQLSEHGVRKGDRVGLLFPNHPDYMASFFAILSLGATIVPINPLLKSPEIAHILADSGTVTLIVHQDSLPEALKSQQQEPKLANIFISPSLPDNLPAANGLKLIALTDKSLAETSTSWQTKVQPEDVALLVYTSGTTGKPKGAMLSHRNLLSVFPARLDLFDIDEPDRTLAVLPMCHIYGIIMLMIGTISKGATLVMLPKFDAASALQLIQQERVTLVPAVPAMYQFMIMESEKNNYDTSSVRLCLSGGASLPLPLIKKIESLFGAPLIEGYALTETACAATINLLHGPRKPGSIGPALPGLHIKIVGDTGLELPPGPEHVGELWIKGPNVMLGYYKQEAATREAIKDGYFATGDLGYKDADNYFYIVGRKKEMIIRGGQNIYPREIEEVLARMEGIADAAVIGVPDEFMGERVKAIIVPKGTAELTAESVKAFCADNLAEYKVPRLVEFRSELPRNSTGKVLKRLLS